MLTILGSIFTSYSHCTEMRENFPEPWWPWDLWKRVSHAFHFTNHIWKVEWILIEMEQCFDQRDKCWLINLLIKTAFEWLPVIFSSRMLEWLAEMYRFWDFLNLELSWRVWRAYLDFNMAGGRSNGWMLFTIL